MLEFGQSPLPLRAATGPDADGRRSGAAGPSQLLRLRAARSLLGHAQTLAGVTGGRKIWRIYAQVGNSAFVWGGGEGDGLLH